MTLAQRGARSADGPALPAGADPGARRSCASARARFADEVLIPLEEEAERLDGRLPAETIDADQARGDRGAAQRRPPLPRVRRPGLDRGSSGRSSRSSSAAPPTGSTGTSRTPTTSGTTPAPSSATATCRPALRGELKDAYAVTEPDAGSDPSGIRDHGRAHRRRLPDQRREVVRHLGRRRLGPDRDGERRRRRAPPPDPVPGRRPTRRASSTSTTRGFTHNYPEGHPTIRFENVEVGADAVIGGVGEGDELQRMWFTEERIAIAARGVGAMWRLLDETVAWATDREQGGARIYDYQGVSFPLADSATDAAAGRLLALTVAALADEGADPQLVHPKASMAKLFVSEAAWRCADRCVQAFGGRGYMRSNVAERLPARAAGRPDLGGHERDPAADRRPRARAPRRRADPPLSAAARGAAMDLAPLLAPRSIAVVGANERPGSYADVVLRNLEAAGFEGRSGASTRSATRSTAAPASRGRRPARAGRRGRRRDPGGRRSRPSSREAGERGCGGAVVISAGFGEIEAGRGLEAELREVALAHDLPVCGPNGNGIVSVGARAPIWGTRSSRSSRARWR